MKLQKARLARRENKNNLGAFKAANSDFPVLGLYFDLLQILFQLNSNILDIDISSDRISHIERKLDGLAHISVTTILFKDSFTYETSIESVNQIFLLGHTIIKALEQISKLPLIKPSAHQLFAI